MMAVILAGGKGTRLRPYTVTIPKPLVPVGEHSILEIIIKQLVQQGFKDVTLAVNHKADLFMAYMGDGSKWGIDISYSVEDKPLGTIGAVKTVSDLPERFLVMNGDILTDLDIRALWAVHVTEGHEITIAVCKRSMKIDFGVIGVAGTKVKRFQEKPVEHFLVSSGIYVFERSVLDRIPDNAFYGFDSLILDRLANNLPCHVYEHKGYWLDIGRPEDYETANSEIKNFLEKTGLNLRD